MARKPQSSVRANAWMPMYWGDYLRDTGHLNAQEHGAYLMLIAHYWCAGRPLTDDNALLAKIGRVTPAVWKKMRPTLAAFFEIDHGMWMHKRVERELTAAADRKESAVARARAGGVALSLKRASSMLGASVEHAHHNHSHNHNTESSSSEISTDAARGSALGGGSEPRAQGGSMKHVLAALAAKHRGTA